MADEIQQNKDDNQANKGNDKTQGIPPEAISLRSADYVHDKVVWNKYNFFRAVKVVQ